VQPKKSIGWLTGVLVSLTILLLSSCGTTEGEATPSSSTTKSAPTSTTEPATTTTRPTPTTTTSTSPATTTTQPAAAQAGAAAVLITLADLPSGWSEVPSSGDTSSGSCLDSAILQGAVPGTGSANDSATATFSQSNLGPFLIAMVTTGIDNASSTFGTLASAITACNATTEAGFTTNIDEVSVPTAGDESFAVRVDISNESGTVVQYFLETARKGDAIVVAANIVSLGDLDQTLVEEAVRTMVGRA
jgi:hypothetical protein